MKIILPFKAVAIGAALVFTVQGCSSRKLLTVQDLLAIPSPKAGRKIFYGEGPLQFGRLRRPDGHASHPVVVVIHGGCWLAEYDLRHIEPLAAAITRIGFATWNLEYRRLGNPGGGWPGTFLDIADGIDHLKNLAEEHHLDLNRMLVIGHSAGGHLALWAAARSELPADSPLFRKNPLIPRGVISLAGIGEPSRLDLQPGCGDAAHRLMGGTAAEFPSRYDQGSPIRLLPHDVPQILIQGKIDPVVRPEGARRYRTTAIGTGSLCRLILLDRIGHYEPVIPASRAWPVVRGALLSLVKD